MCGYMCLCDCLVALGKVAKPNPKKQSLCTVFLLLDNNEDFILTLIRFFFLAALLSVCLSHLHFVAVLTKKLILREA